MIGVFVASLSGVALLDGEAPTSAPQVSADEIAAGATQQRDEIEHYLDRQIADADRQRKAAWKRDFSSLEAYERSVAPWRERLWTLLGGKPYEADPLHPREELVAEFPTHRAYRIWLDAFADVHAYGILLVPRGGAPLPGLICIHGMAGSPEGVCGLTANDDYHHRFGLQAALRGYVVFAPLDINSQKARSWLDRKAILIGQRLQGLEMFKLQRVVDYLCSRRDVDAQRIGAYGISWGGRSAMYLAALDRRIAASVISGHFNELIPKMVTPDPHSSAFIETPEDYAFFWRHFLLFNDADVVSLICPRPICLEQGRQDRVAYWRRSKAAFAAVQSIYDRLHIGDRAEYDLFEGPHEIHGVEAFAFLDRWLKPERR